MNYHHIDHLDTFASGLKVGNPISKGELIGYCGKTGTGSPHCHYEVMNQKPERWLQYPSRWSKAKIKQFYLDPSPYITATLPMKWNKLGYDWLSPIAGGGWHLGKDLNWGSGFDDFRIPIYATVDGIIEYIGKKETDGGAGNNFWWSEQVVTKPVSTVDVAFGKAQAGRFFLSVEEHGEAWFVTREGVRAYIGATPAEMLDFVKKHAVGITKADLNKIPQS
jgi:murein DD-endopeptidase MepM/ murein hydrolase activator NlpD